MEQSYFSLESDTSSKKIKTPQPSKKITPLQTIKQGREPSENPLNTEPKQATQPLSPISHNEQVLSVSQYTALIKKLLENQIPAAWVRGEVSNLKEQTSGHIYFTLKDTDSQLSVVLFRGVAAQQRLKLKNGQALIVFGEISLYEPRGQYQMIARCLLDEGAGRLKEAFERLKERLTQEGLFDKEKKKKLPTFPKCIGIITSETGAVIQDFVRILQRGNWTGTILLFPTKVQGPGAIANIIEQIHNAQKNDKLDLLVIARGGGSLEDLWAFNEEIVVRALAASKIPTMSAIGHETDFTLCDFAADQRAETPSAAAGWILKQKEILLNTYEKLAKQLNHTIQQHLKTKSHLYALYTQKLKTHQPQSILENKILRLDELHNRLITPIKGQLNVYNKKWHRLNQQLQSHHPQSKIAFYHLKTTQYSQLIKNKIDTYIKSIKTQVEYANNRLTTSHPQHILARGFIYLTADDQTLIAHKSSLKDHQKITLHFVDGYQKGHFEKE